uniref:COR domain-containing protein n=1 Tax=Candidatus Electronema sp. TaxID=2698783 RepID=UPI00405777CA
MVSGILLVINNCTVTELPEIDRPLTEVQGIHFCNNQLTKFPESLRKLTKLQNINIISNRLTVLPEWLGQLRELRRLNLSQNKLTDLPRFILNLTQLQELKLDENPLNPELAAAYAQGLDAVKAYLRAKADSITLNEAKLILIGEGEVGKSCLLGALRGDPWEEGRPTTHGIEIKSVLLTDSESGKELTLNGWDFGGQRVYRPTHQLFFSAPAVYLVVWKPREGPQQGCVQEWIQLIKRREPDAKILVIATHGGPKQRQPDIDRQELWDMFGKETVLDFFFVESKPDAADGRRGIEKLKQRIAEVAVSLPEVGRSVPKSFQEVRQDLRDIGKPFLPLEQVLSVCRDRKMDDETAKLFITISHRLGHLIHYEHDKALHNLVVLKPDWLATAISFVLDDEETRSRQGLVRLSRLSQLWNDPGREEEFRYPAELHQVFLALMGKFDLSYRAAEPGAQNEDDPLSLIAQLVRDTRPAERLAQEWPQQPGAGDIEQRQICRIVDDKGQSANAEGLFYQLIVRLHKYSLGRADHRASVHWQRGLLLDDDYNGRALLEHKGNDIHLTVRAPYPERFLDRLTSEVKYLVEYAPTGWHGLRCNVMVPCLLPPCQGLFDIKSLIESKREGFPKFPCPTCNKWQNIDELLRNAPSAKPISLEQLQAEFAVVNGKLDRMDATTSRILSQIDKSFSDLFQLFVDEAKEGPRLFSLYPVDPGFFDKPDWISHKFRLVLWCEHSRLPLPLLNGADSKQGVYELDFSRQWVTKTAPFFQTLTATLSLVLPAAASGIKLALDDPGYKAIEEQLGFGKDCFDAMLKGGKNLSGWISEQDAADLPHGAAVRADGAVLRELHSLLKTKDLGFGGLKKVLNKRQEFLWVHPQFAGEY